MDKITIKDLRDAMDNTIEDIKNDTGKLTPIITYMPLDEYLKRKKENKINV